MNETKTSIEKLATMNLEGLFLPEPASLSFWWLWLVLGLLFLIVAMIWMKKYHSTKATALRDLKQLEKKLSISICEQEQLKKQIACALRLGFKVTRLDYVMPENIKWREYLVTLETAIYANKSSDPDVLKSLVKDAQAWLRSSP